MLSKRYDDDDDAGDDSGANGDAAQLSSSHNDKWPCCCQSKASMVSSATYSTKTKTMETKYTKKITKTKTILKNIRWR